MIVLLPWAQVLHVAFYVAVVVAMFLAVGVFLDMYAWDEEEK